jgi:hypothetical protein
VSRDVSVVLCEAAGEMLGQLPAFEVALPWWPAVGEVVETVSARFGLDIVVLRLIDASTASNEMGGEVRYHVDDVPAARRAAAALV